MKRTIGIAVTVALLASIFSTSPALAAEPKVKPPKCTKSKAVPTITAKKPVKSETKEDVDKSDDKADNGSEA